MKLQICLKSFFTAIVCLVICASVMSGSIQKMIPFESVASEMGVALLSFTMGILSLGFSFSLKKA